MLKNQGEYGPGNTGVDDYPLRHNLLDNESALVAIKTLQYTHNWLLVGKLHGQDLGPDINYWQKVIAIIDDPNRAYHVHKFIFARDENGERLPGIVNLMNFVGVNGLVDNEQMGPKTFIAVCWGVDEGL